MSFSTQELSPFDNYRPVTIFWPCPEVIIISDKHCNDVLIIHQSNDSFSRISISIHITYAAKTDTNCMQWISRTMNHCTDEWWEHHSSHLHSTLLCYCTCRSRAASTSMRTTSCWAPPAPDSWTPSASSSPAVPGTGPEGGIYTCKIETNIGTILKVIMSYHCQHSLHSAHTVWLLCTLHMCLARQFFTLYKKFWRYVLSELFHITV